uniref:Uncharacterized protein n=1 Tax=Aegilops tauschii TaxID=37682 RepID=N1QT33_AEGTA
MAAASDDAPAAVSDAASSPSSSRELLQLFCFKKPPALASTYAQEPTQAVAEVVVDEDEDEDDDAGGGGVGVGGEEGRGEAGEAQLRGLGSLVGPPRLLFTIKEETKEDLESEDGRSRCGRSRSLGDLLHCSETPYLTPASSPLPPAMEKSYNPLFESPAASPAAVAASPPPKLQFLKDAEEKLYRRALAEEAKRARGSPSPSPAAGEEDGGGYITIVVGKNTRVIPLPSPPGSA